LDQLKDWAADEIIEFVRADTPHGEHGLSEHTMRFKFEDKYYNITVDNIEWNRHDKQFYFIEMYGKPNVIVKEVDVKNTPEAKGVIELLWDLFGGTVNAQGYKVLDPHIGAIYGDSITIDRANEICRRLEAKGFASTNIVLGIGSYTYQYNTRDTFGFAMKATYCEISKKCNECKGEYCWTCLDEGVVKVPKEIFKDPGTDNGVKKSAKGLLSVGIHNVTGKYGLQDQCTWDEEATGELRIIFENGKFFNQTTLTKIREVLNANREK